MAGLRRGIPFQVLRHYKVDAHTYLYLTRLQLVVQNMCTYSD